MIFLENLGKCVFEWKNGFLRITRAVVAAAVAAVVTMVAVTSRTLRSHHLIYMAALTGSSNRRSVSQIYRNYLLVFVCSTTATAITNTTTTRVRATCPGCAYVFSRESDSIRTESFPAVAMLGSGTGRGGFQ